MPSLPRVSVITPTFGRPDFLPRLHRVFAAQVNVDAEWIVVDDSPEESPFMRDLADSRVRYIHLRERVTTGEKRNLAAGQSAGEVIVQFDDDDYYSPAYTQTMLECMANQGADFVKLSAFFLYSSVDKQFGYWDMQKKDAAFFAWAPRAKVAPIEVPPGPELDNIHLGFGFSYVFKRAVWEAGRFPDRAWGEDTPLLHAAVANGFNVSLVNDQVGLCLHIIHDRNGSRSLAQYILPKFVMRRLFPDLDPAFL